MANDSEDSPMKLVRKPRSGCDENSPLLRELDSFLGIAAEAGLHLRVESRAEPTQWTAFLCEQLNALRKAWEWKEADVDVVAKLTSPGAVILTERENQQLLQLITELLRKSRSPDLEIISGRLAALALHLDLKLQQTRELQAYLADLTTENELLRSENAEMREQIASQEELTCTSKFGSSDLDEIASLSQDCEKENEPPSKKGHRARAPTFASQDFVKGREELKYS